MPACRSTTGKYQSSVLSSPVSSSMTGCSAWERLRTLSSVVCAISATSRNSARNGEPSGAWLPARDSMAPTAVRIWPNSSCSSREMWRKVDSWVEISFCASSLRCSESAASCANNCRLERIEYKPGQQDRHQRERQEEIHLPLHPVVNLGDALGRLLFAFVVLHQQARHCRAQARPAAPATTSWIWLRASSGLPFAASAKVRSTASQNWAMEFLRY